VIFSDTPGIIAPEYKLHEKMMQAVKSALEDADLALLLVDLREDPEEAHKIFETLKLRVPALVILNKTDQVSAEAVQRAQAFFAAKPYCREVVAVSALRKDNLEALTAKIIDLLPEGNAFFPEDELTDLPTRFFTAELIREKIFELFEQEIPYHATVLVTEFKELPHLVRIKADIIVQRESQKAILLGGRGAMIKKLGTEARTSIESFLGQKVYLELFVKVRPKWRDNELHLREYGYN
jgi:GTP-binding protein Era